MQIKSIIFIVASASFIYANIDDIYSHINTNYKIKSLNKDIKIKKLNIQQVKNNYYPQISAKLSYNIDNISQDFNNNTSKKDDSKYSAFEIDVNQKILDFQINPLLSKAKSNLKYSISNKDYYYNQILFKSLSLYFNILENKKLLNFLQEKYKNLELILKELQAKNKFKFTSQIEILKTQKKYLDIKNLYLKVKYNNLISIETLKKLLNFQNITFNEEHINFPKHLPTIHLENPELNLYKYKKEVALNDAKIKKAKMYPSIDFSLQYTVDFYHTYKEKELYGSLSMNVPFFNKSDNTDYESAKVNLQKESLNLLDKKAQIDIKLKKSELEFQQLRQILQNSYQSLELVKKLKSQIEISYNNKMIDKSKYLLEKNKIIDIKIDIIKKELSLIKVYLDYLYATGGIKKKRFIDLLF